MYDIIIIGAGASALMAAWDLSVAGKKVVVIEAKDRIGGRVLDIYDPRFTTPVELGAEFMHGDLELTQFIAKKARADIYERKGDVLKYENGKLMQSDFIEDYSVLEKKFRQLKQDISVLDFINTYLNEDEHQELRKSLVKYVEGYYAADLSQVSTFALRNEMQNSSDKQFSLTNGYMPLLNFMRSEAEKNGCRFVLSSPVSAIEWRQGHVSVRTKQQSITASAVLITVSIGVLQSESLQFIPDITDRVTAAKQLGFGNVIKIVMQFEKPFWKEKEETKKLSFLFSEEDIPTWWTMHPRNSNELVGWLGGPKAKELQYANEEEIKQKALRSLSNIFSIDQIHLDQMLITFHYFNWMNDPRTLGAYSYDVVNGDHFKQIIKQPVSQTIFFAGEGLYEGPEIGTVEAALFTGRNAARQILKNSL